MAAGILDYIVFGVTLVISLAVGLWFGWHKRKQNTLFNYLFGNQQFNVIPLGMSFAVTIQSSIQIIGYPTEIYAYGVQYLLIMVPLGFCYLWTGVLIVPLLKSINVSGVFEYFQLRFKSNKIRLPIALLSVTETVIIMAIATFCVSLVMETVTGLPVWAGICMVMTSSLVYTSLGGIKAVVYNDVILGVVKWIGIFVLVVKCTINAGGLSYVLATSYSRLSAFDIRVDPTVRHTVWSLLFCYISNSLSMLYGPGSLQRIYSSPDVRKARYMLGVGYVLMCLFYFLISYIGLAAFAYFTSVKCDPFASKMLHNVNQIVPFTVMRVFENVPGLTGLFIATLSAATLSTLASNLSAIATTVTEDVLKQCCTTIDVSQRLRLARLTTFLFGILGGIVAYLFSFMSGPLMQMLVMARGVVSGPKLGIFLLSFHVRRVTPLAIYIGVTFGVAMTAWISLGKILTPNLPSGPMLPSGPTEGCSLNNSLAIYTNDYINDTYVILSVNSTAPYSNTSVTTSLHSKLEDERYKSITAKNIYNDTQFVSGITKVYTVSYLFISPIGTLVTFLVGVAISLLQTANGTVVDVDPDLMVSFKHVTCGHGTPTVSDKEQEVFAVEENTPTIEYELR